MTQREKVIKAAKQQLGYIEPSSGTTKYGEWYAKFMNVQGQGFESADWCAMFCGYCQNSAGVTTSQTVYTASAGATGEALYKQKGIWQGSSYTPKPADLIHFAWGHVGIVTKVSGGYVYTIEGNTTSNSGVQDCVAEKSYSLSYSGIRGYATPKYTEEQEDNYMECKKGDINVFVLSVKVLLQQARRLGIITTACDNTKGFGDGTEKAVLEFQKYAGLTQDAIVGEKTVSALRTAIEKNLETAKKALGA